MDAHKPNQKPSLKRRHFLLALGAGSAGAAAVATATLAGKTLPAADAAKRAASEATPGYSESEHVNNYYRTARI